MSTLPSTESKPMIIRKKLIKPQTKRDKLPIANYEHDFIKRLEREKILVVEASTGSGKSTQLPQYVAKSDLFQAERRKVVSEIKYGGNKSPLGLATQGKMVVSTQPNAFAAAAVATRVGFEYDDDHLGRKVGLITPTESKFDPTQCEILFVSDSELVRIMTQDKLLSRVGVLIIDEAHERTLYTDVIMTLAKEIREQREDFYIVISSATIEVKRFLSFMFNIEDAAGGGQHLYHSRATLGFRPTPLTVQGKTYEVSVSYDPMEVRDPTSEKDPYLSQILTPKLAQVLRKNLNREVKGHALVFVEDTHTVLRVVHHLRRYLRLQTKLAQEQGIDPANTTKFLTSENTRVIPLYLSMPLKEQQRIMDFVRSFQSNSGKEIRYVFVADNVAETSITLPDVKLVIDTGRMMVSHYDMMRRLMVTEETFVSKDRAAQRQGRTGRTSPGMCVRLYNETDLKLDRVEPDIKRVALDKVALQLAAMNINPKALRLIEPPEDHKFVFAIEQLIQYQCLVSNAQKDFASHLEITDKGRVFVQLPFAPDTCEQLWQASLISAEATTIMHAVSCLFNNESSNIFEHSAGNTWKALAEQILDERKFDITPQVGINNNLLASQHWTSQSQPQQDPSTPKSPTTTATTALLQMPTLLKQASSSINPLANNPNPVIVQHNTSMRDPGTKSLRSQQDPHLWYNPFWQTNSKLKFGFNLNSGSDLELGYLMYILLMHYQKPNCATCQRRLGVSSAPLLSEIEGDTISKNETEQFSVVNRGKTNLDDLGLDNDENQSTDAQSNTTSDFKRCELCFECENDFREVYKVLPTAIKQAENFIRSTRDLVHRSLGRNYSIQPKSADNNKNQDRVKNINTVLSSQYKPHPDEYPPTRIMTHCIYTALSHMAGIVLVTDHLSEGVVLPHKYFKMVKAAIDPNACSNTVDTYYKLVTVPQGKIRKTRYTCVKHFIVIHVTARQAHDYNITCLHPFDLDELQPLAQEDFRQNISSLQLQRVAQFAHVGRGLYSSIDYVLSNQRIDNMARQYELERSHLRQQQLRSQGNMQARTDDSETTRNMEAMNWSRFAAIPFSNGVMALHTLLRYSEETQRRIEEIISIASRHMQHLYERERRSYRLPLSNVMFADLSLSHDFSLKELIIHADGKSFAVRPADIQAMRYQRPQGGGVQQSALSAAFKGKGVTLGSKSTQLKQIGLAPQGGQQSPMTTEKEDALNKEFGTGDNVAAVATNVRDVEELWRFQAQAYEAANMGEDEDDDIQMLDDDDILLPGVGGTNLQTHGSSHSNSGGLAPPTLLQQRSLDRLPSGSGISYTYSQSTDRHRNELALAQVYDPLQITRFPKSQWYKHDSKKQYTNTLSCRKRIDLTAPVILAKLATVWDIQNNVRPAQDHIEEDLLRSVSPLREIYTSIHQCFEQIIQSLKVLHRYQYFPLIPEFADYSSTVTHIYDQSTALLKFNNDTDMSAGLRDILSQYSSYDEGSGDYFIASLLDIQQCYNVILGYIELKIKSLARPHDLAKDLNALLSFNLSIFVSLHFELGPRDLTSWIQLAPQADKLFDLSIEKPIPGQKLIGVRRFIAPSKDRFRILSEPVLDKEGRDLRESLLCNGYLVDQSDLRLLQTSEAEVQSYFSTTLNIAGFDLLYTISATVDHSEIVDVKDALRQIRSTLIQLNGQENYKVEVLEQIEIEIAPARGSAKPHLRTQITFAGNQTTVLQSAHTLLKISEPSTIPVGPLTNSTNALLQFMTESGLFYEFVAKHHVAAEYIRHGSDGTVSVWGSAQNVHKLDTELKGLVAEFEKRRQAFPLPHNIFADLKNDNENSAFYSAYQLLTQQIDRVSNKTAKYQLKTDETSFILETITPEDLQKCLPAIRGFKSKCGIDEDTKLVPCFICLQNSSGTVQRLSSCDHPICGQCLAAHTEAMINHQRQALLQREIDRQESIEKARSGGGDDDDGTPVGGIAKAKVSDEQYLQSQHEDQVKLLSELRQTFELQCPCYQCKNHGGGEYFVTIAGAIGVTRRAPSQLELDSGRGCQFSILPSDIVRICTPSQIHNILFMLAKPVMKATNAYLPCPSSACNTLIQLRPYYQQCPRCNVGTCTQCNVTNSSLHQLVPCHIFKGILSYHDEVQTLFADDTRKLLDIVVTVGKKDVGDLSKLTSRANTILRPYLSQEQQTRAALCTLIIEQTQKYLNDDWLKHSFSNKELVSVIPHLYINPGIFSQCGSYIRFIKGCREKLSKIPAYHSVFSRGRQLPIEYDTKTHYALFNELFLRSGAKFAYHGTPDPKNVKPIMHGGLDPSFRRGQAYGPGEYLGVSPSVSFDYGREFFLIVLFLDQPDLYTTQPGFCYVIKNPVDFKSAYCLPVGFVRVSNTSSKVEIPHYPSPLEFDIPGIRTSSSAWLAHVGMDTGGTLAKAMYKDEKLEGVLGVPLPKDVLKVDLTDFKNLPGQYVPDQKLYSGKCLK